MATYIVSKNTTGTYTNTGQTGVNDTRMNGLAPTTNYSSGSILSTNCWDESVDDVGNSVIKFDVSAIGAGTVTNSEIGFYLNGGNNDFRGVSIFQLLVSFVDTQVTFNIRATSTNWNTPNARGSGTDRGSTALLTTSRPATSGAWMTFSGAALDALIEDFLDGTTTNNGFVIELTDYADDLFTYQDYVSSEGTDGQRPYLKFDHTSSGVSGSASVTTSDDSSSASGSTTVTGSTALTTIGDSSTASGTTTVVGSLNVTTANDTSSANGSPIVNGTIAVTTGDDTSTASGSVGGAVDGTANITTQDDTSNTSGTTTILGVASSVTSDDTSNASGSTTVVGSASVTTGDDTSSANGSAGTPTGTASITTGNDICTAFGIVPQENLFGGVAHFKILSERSRKLRELEAQERTEALTSEDIAEVIQIPQEVKEIISNVAKIDNEKKQRAQLKAQLKALEIQFRQEYSDALKTEMIRQYLIIEQERQEEEETISMLMMALV